jgi:hypothetical protein
VSHQHLAHISYLNMEPSSVQAGEQTVGNQRGDCAMGVFTACQLWGVCRRNCLLCIAL